MRLFWKVFLTLMLSLLLTAIASSWLSRAWMQEDRAIDARMQQLTSFGSTAASLFETGGARAYRQWLRQHMRSRHFRGALIDRNGRHILAHPLPPELDQLAKRVIAKQQSISLVDLPRLVVAIPVSTDKAHYYWLASAHLSRNEMRRSSNHRVLLRLAMALLAMAAVSWLLTRMFTGPIRQLQHTAIRLGRGDLTTATPGNLSGRKDELGDLARSFDTMTGQLAMLINSQQQLLRDISHELRSPLARLQVALELARNEAGENAAAELDRIELEAERLNELIGEVLTLARFEQGAVQASLQTIALDQVLRDIAEDAAFEAAAMDKTVTCVALAPCSIMADSIWIRRALENVIRNAIRHTTSSVEISLTVPTQAKQLHIMIRDHGKGVDEAQLPRLFDPFFRASEAREHDGSGYGLGLAIAKRAIDMHFGKIIARNHPDGGLQVEISLPRLA
ncbi:MAG: ATP-binding protein [Mariprofundus sp.]